MSNKIKAIIVAVAIAIIGTITGVAVNININVSEEAAKVNATIEYSEKNVPATVTVGEEEIEGIETGQGAVGEEVEVQTINGQEIKTVESIDNNGPVMDVKSQECPEGEECGQGAAYPQLDISSPQSFTNDVLGKCIDVDGYYGAQCWDLAAALHHELTGRVLTTCGTGAAKGVIADGCWQINNAGNEYEMAWDPYQIKTGAVVYFKTGTWGHVGIALGPVHDGYITLLGQNQGGASCAGGGSAANVINISIRDFIGAMMPRIWIIPDPVPEPEPEPVVDVCTVREVKKGDTLGAIMKECEGETKWGEDMNAYARKWVSTKTVPGQTVFSGWTSVGRVGLFAGDVIEYKAGE